MRRKGASVFPTEVLSHFLREEHRLGARVFCYTTAREKCPLRRLRKNDSLYGTANMPR
jgi:hypothetical protein